MYLIMIENFLTHPVSMVFFGTFKFSDCKQGELTNVGLSVSSSFKTCFIDPLFHTRGDEGEPGSKLKDFIFLDRSKNGNFIFLRKNFFKSVRKLSLKEDLHFQQKVRFQRIFRILPNAVKILFLRW